MYVSVHLSKIRVLGSANNKMQCWSFVLGSANNRMQCWSFACAQFSFFLMTLSHFSRGSATKTSL